MVFGEVPMAKAGITFETMMRDLKGRRFSPIYILMGEESYFIDQIADYLAEHVLQPEERDFNQNIVFGSDVNAAQIVDLAKGYPMMSEYRVVIVKEAQNLRGTEVIEKYLENPVKSSILVLCHKNGTIDRRKRLVSKAEAVGVVFESKKMRETELSAFVASNCLSRKITIDEKSIAMIVDHIGSDLNRLVSVIDKLQLFLPENDRVIRPEMIEKQIGVSKDFNAFELKNALINRDVFKANQIIKYFDNNPKAGSVFAYLPLLFGYFQNLMIAYYAPAKNENAVAQYLELKGGWAARDYITGMRNYSGSKTMQIISKFKEIDAKIKGIDNRSIVPGDLMKELIFFILH